MDLGEISGVSLCNKKNLWVLTCVKFNYPDYSIIYVDFKWPIPVAARSKAWFCGRWLTRIVGSNPAGAWMSVSCECCVLYR